MFGAIEKSIPKILRDMPNEQLIKFFYFMNNNPEATQKVVLQDILKCAEKSRYGKEMGFSEIKSIDDFKRKVPITTYKDYEPYIEKIKMGESDVLFNGEPSRFIATSGSSGVPKLIPESDNGECIKAIISQIRGILLIMLAPEVMVPDKKILAITNPSEYDKTEGGVPIGSASGQAAKDMPKEMQNKMILPLELMAAKDLSNEAIDYLTILFALKEKNLAGVVCSNIAHFNILLNKMDNYVDMLIADINNATISSKILMDEGLRECLSAKLKPNPERAAELREIYRNNKGLDVGFVWPALSVISCWMSASAQRIVTDIKLRLPRTIKFLEWGYGASEGKFNIPTKADDPSGFLGLFGYYFEFLPLGAENTLAAHELKPREYYELIITSYSGLYRYNMKDIVCVRSIENQSPRIVFISKSSECLKLSNLELMAYEIDEIIKKAANNQNDDIRFIQILADEKEKKLVFILEPISLEFSGASFRTSLEETLMKENRIYNENRRLNQFAAVEILIMKQGYRDSLFTRSIMTGKNVNQTKLKTIVDEYPENSSIFNWVKGDEK
ncbi:MAG: GH3 auxin-responsive promoter family protein [Acetobacterium sp.]